MTREMEYAKCIAILCKILPQRDYYRSRVSIYKGETKRQIFDCGKYG